MATARKPVLMYGQLPANSAESSHRIASAQNKMPIGINSSKEKRSVVPSIDLRLDQDGCWPDIGEKSKANLLRTSEAPLGMALLTDGMRSGRPSVSLRIDLPDGQLVFIQTSLRLLAAAVRTMEVRARRGRSKNPEPGEDDQVLLED
jgi:hypothetical protein